MVWMQYTVYTVEQWYMVVGTLSLIQKGQTRGCSTQYAVCSRIVVYGVGDIALWCKKVKPENTVDAIHSGIVVYGGGDIVFGAKRSNQWMQYAACSGIVVYGGGGIVFDAKRSNQWIQWMQSHSGHSTQWTQ